MVERHKLAIGGASLTAARLNRHSMPVMCEVNEQLESELLAVDFLKGAPFKWIGLILRFGLVNEDVPHYQRINKKYGDLPVAIELDTHELRNASRDELKEKFLVATLKTLIDIARKYNLPGESFERMLADHRRNTSKSAGDPNAE